MNKLKLKTIFISSFIIFLIITYFILYTSKPPIIQQEIKIQQAGNQNNIEISSTKIILYSIFISFILSIFSTVFIYSKF